MPVIVKVEGPREGNKYSVVCCYDKPPTSYLSLARELTKEQAEKIANQINEILQGAKPVISLEEFDRRAIQAQELENQSRDLHQQSITLEQRTLKEAGIHDLPREPGFPCWVIEGMGGYYHTPRQALEARLTYHCFNSVTKRCVYCGVDGIPETNKCPARSN